MMTAALKCNLKYNFALHLTNLKDFGQLTQAQHIILWKKLMNTHQNLKINK